jgi:hypothetical protein
MYGVRLDRNGPGSALPFGSTRLASAHSSGLRFLRGWCASRSRRNTGNQLPESSVDIHLDRFELIVECLLDLRGRSAGQRAGNPSRERHEAAPVQRSYARQHRLGAGRSHDLAAGALQLERAQVGLGGAQTSILVEPPRALALLGLQPANVALHAPHQWIFAVICLRDHAVGS